MPTATKKAPTKKAATTTKKGTKKPAKKPVAKKTAVKEKSKSGLTSSQQSVVDYLAKHKATSASNGIKREKVWKECKNASLHIIAQLKKTDLLCRADLEDGTKEYYLTTKGKSLASK